MNINEQHRANLQRLADELRKPIPMNFNMKEFATGATKAEYVSPQILKKCGTSCCAIGLAALVFPKVAKDCSDYWLFSEKLFGNLPGRDWAYMSDHRWTEIDNTPSGCADRIEQYLATGVPKDWPGFRD